MTIFRWIMGVLVLVLGGSSVLCFALFMAFDINVWLDRARSLRRGAYLAVLFWFNTEVWGSVAYTLIHWGGG